MHICVVTVIFQLHHGISWPKNRRFSISWLANSEQIFQIFQILISTKIHEFHEIFLFIFLGTFTKLLIECPCKIIYCRKYYMAFLT